MTILEELAEYARERTAKAKSEIPLDVIKRQALSLPKGEFAFENALRKPDISFICECKKSVSLERTHRSRFSVPANRKGVRSGRRGLYFRADRAEMVSRKR